MYKKTSILLVIIGIIAIFIGELFFTHINTANAVDSHSWGIYLNGIRSFKWPDFVGFEMIALGLMIYFTVDMPEGKQFS